ncbi:MAG: signal peptidase II [Dermatophilus congolensis]|nr:signal peptidase II [Dermatophilus congolensis]
MTDVHPPATPPASATGRLPKLRWWPGALVIVIGVVVYAADQWAKNVALAELRPGVPVPVIGEVLEWRLVFNPGAAFSLGTGITPVFTLFQAAVSIAVLVLAWRLRSVWWAVALGLVLGGATGNLHDRLLRPPSFGHGHVVDYIALPNFPVFNIADSAITTAAVMILVAAVFGWEAFRTREETAALSEEERRG